MARGAEPGPGGGAGRGCRSESPGSLREPAGGWGAPVLGEGGDFQASGAGGGGGVEVREAGAPRPEGTGRSSRPLHRSAPQVFINKPGTRRLTSCLYHPET
jgi:hypothetical protein